MARKPISYWEKRQTQLMKRLERKTEPTINEIMDVYRQATNNINKEIVRIYNNYGKDSGLSKQALDHLLNTRETQTHYKNLLQVIQNNISDEDLKKKLLAKYTAPAYNYRISRYQALQENIDMELKKAADKEIEITRLRYVDTIKSGYYRNIFDIQKGLNLAFHFNEIDNKTINLLLNEKWTNNANFSTRIWKNNEKLGEYLKTQLSAASLSGKSIQKISSDLAHYMNVGVVQATTLVRTEVNHFANEAEMMVYEELDIEEYRFIATLDKVTCMHCGKLDKRKFKVKEKKIGVNYPPIHPNDRCTTIPVFDDQNIDELKRRARDPDTNQNYILDENMSYTDWYNKNINKTSKLKNTTKNAKISKNIIDINDLPKEFLDKKNMNTTKIVVDYLNNLKNADPRVLKLYKNIDNIQEMPFKISNAKKYQLKVDRAGRNVKQITLTIPKIDDKDEIGLINTWLHENIHFIDLMLESKDINNFEGYFSTRQLTLHTAIKNSTSDIGPEVKKVFTEFNNKYDDIKNKLLKETNKKIDVLEAELKANKISLKECNKQYRIIKNEFETTLDLEGRKLMGGGVNNLQDIYDALSKGTYRDMDIVKYGHGTKYYQTMNERIKEITAQYGTLSVSRPDLIELLKQDKPELTKELDNLIDKMLISGGIK